MDSKKNPVTFGVLFAYKQVYKKKAGTETALFKNRRLV
jgi:hypothetical protein